MENFILLCMSLCGVDIYICWYTYISVYMCRPFITWSTEVFYGLDLKKRNGDPGRQAVEVTR